MGRPVLGEVSLDVHCSLFIGKDLLTKIFRGKNYLILGSALGFWDSSWSIKESVVSVLIGGVMDM